MTARLVARLAARPALLLVIVALLGLPTLFTGLAADDRFHLLAARGEMGPWWGPWNLFTFCPDDEAARAALRERGVIGWWGSPVLTVSFWRPLTSLTHWLDYRLLGERAWLMHLQNLGWYLGIVALAAGLYRRLLPAVGVAPAWAWAALLFAVDDGHGVAMGWLASRNALVSAAFGLVALRAHLDTLRDGRRPWLGPLAFLGCLLGAEAGVAWLGYPVALALVGRRPGPVLPWLGVLVGWRVAWHLAGGGLHGAGVYVDPIATPGTFLAALGPRVAVALLAQVSFVPPEVMVLAGDLTLPLAAVAVLVVGGLGLVVLRDAPEGRTWALGALLGCVPLAASFPQDRTLLPASFGVFAALGTWLAATPRPVWLARTVVAVHVGFAVLAFVPRAAAFTVIDRLLMARVALLPTDRPAVVWSTAVDPVVMLFGVLRPGTVTLASGQVALSARRVATDRLVVDAPGGWMPGPVDRMMRTEPFEVGDHATSGGLEVTVLAITPDGRPSTVEVRGDLEGRAWYAEQDGRLGPVALPAVGATIELPAPGMPRG